MPKSQLSQTRRMHGAIIGQRRRRWRTGHAVRGRVITGNGTVRLAPGDGGQPFVSADHLFPALLDAVELRPCRVGAAGTADVGERMSVGHVATFGGFRPGPAPPRGLQRSVCPEPPDLWVGKVSPHSAPEVIQLHLVNPADRGARRAGLRCERAHR